MAMIGSLDHPMVTIIGGGFGGMCMAIKLKEQGINSFRIIEKLEDIGGTWLHNRYVRVLFSASFPCARAL